MEHQAVEWLEWAVHRILFWEEDDARKGRIVRAIHHLCSNALLTLIVVSHTIYPAFWLQTVLLGFCTIVWIQHVVTHGCIISKVEQRLIGDTKSFIDPYLELFRVEATPESKSGLLTMGSTIGVAVLSLEWIGRVHHKMLPLIKTLALKAPSLVTSSVPGIPLQLSSLSG